MTLAAREEPAIGTRLRAERERQGIGLRELARRVDVSASLVSQIELGRATPSVGTLYAIAAELGLSLDELFAAEAPPRLEPAAPGGPVVRIPERQVIHFESGVTWERMSPPDDHGVDFLHVVYEVGGASAPEDSLVRHGGREYGHLLEGRLGVTVGFETYVLLPGDAIAFDSSAPHRLFNAGDAPARAIWFVVGREDPRVTR